MFSENGSSLYMWFWVTRNERGVSVWIACDGSMEFTSGLDLSYHSPTKRKDYIRSNKPCDMRQKKHKCWLSSTGLPAQELGEIFKEDGSDGVYLRLEELFHEEFPKQ